MVDHGQTISSVEDMQRALARLNELEPPAGFTIPEWHIAQTYACLLWPPDTEAELPEHRALRAAFEKRFAAQVKKFADYMGWK